MSQEEFQELEQSNTTATETDLGISITPFRCEDGHTVFFTTKELFDEHERKAHLPVRNIHTATSPLKLYVCGPMTGFENFNYDAFNLAAAHLRLSGYEVENPADAEGENTTGEPQLWHWYMRRAITKLMLCDGIALLDGWEASKGAQIEVNLAYNLGMELRHIDAWLTA